MKPKKFTQIFNYGPDGPEGPICYVPQWAACGTLAPAAEVVF